MKLAVIIPTRNRHEALRRCLLQIASAGQGVVIVVSDDGNVEETHQILGAEFPGVHFIQGPQKGPAANRNHGAAQTSADLLVFLDDDCIPEEGLIDAYRKFAMQMPEVGVFEGRISALGEPRGFGDCVPANETGGHLWSCNFAIRSSVFQELRGFDERFVFAANEDSDIYLRARKIAAVRFIPEARVFHHYETRLGERPLRHKGMSTILYLQIHTPQVTGITLSRSWSPLRNPCWWRCRNAFVSTPPKTRFTCCGWSFTTSSWQQSWPSGSIAAPWSGCCIAHAVTVAGRCWSGSKTHRPSSFAKPV